jgi:hypothetical protein
MLKRYLSLICRPENFSDFTLFCGFFCIQLLLRFSEISFHGIWRDEVASLYFSTHLGQVLQGDSHSIFYYLLLAPVTFFDPLNIELSRLFQSFLSLLCFISLMVRSRGFFSKGEWFFFHTIYGLHPLVFGFSRLARPYILVIDLTALLIIESRQLNSKKLLFLIATSLTSFYPLGVFPLMIEGFISNRKKEVLKIFFAATLPALFYYSLKFIFDPNKFVYISWIKGAPDIFLNEISNMLMGSYFPFYNYLPNEAGRWILLVLIIFMTISVFLSKSRRGAGNLVVFVASFGVIFLGINLLSPWLDLRINRYYVFLFPYLLLALTTTTSFKALTQRALTVLFGGLLLAQVIFLNPYFSPQDSFGSFIQEIRKISKMYKNSPVLACGYPYLNWYFGKNGFQVCSDQKRIEEIFSQQDIFIYAYIDRMLLGLAPFVKGKKIIFTIAHDSGKILVLGDIHGNPKK